MEVKSPKVERIPTSGTPENRFPKRIEPSEDRRPKFSQENRFPTRIEPKTPQREVKETRMKTIEIPFKCPADANTKEFCRQLKGQERGLNSMSVSEWSRNRRNFLENGRADEGMEAQRRQRDKAFASRIKYNQEKRGMEYSQAKLEAQNWIKTQAALHNPDQIAGGDPTKVSRMGDAKVNTSIGAQWKSRIGAIDRAVAEFSKGKTPEELANCKMNVRLIVEV